MQSYQFTGYTPRIYQYFNANPGDVREFDTPPSDDLWVPVDGAPTEPAPGDWWDNQPAEQETVTPPSQESSN